MFYLFALFVIKKNMRIKKVIVLKKKLLFLVWSFTLIMTLTACGSKANANSKSHGSDVKKTSSVQTTTINWKKPSENKPYPNMNVKKTKLVIGFH